MRSVIRSASILTVVFGLMAGVVAAQCKPSGGCKPQASGCSPKTAAGCKPKTAGCTPKGGCGAAPKMAGPAKKKTLVGLVSDTACGAKHTMMPGKSDAECTNACVSKGSKFALVVGKKVYTLEGQSEELGKLAGQKAKVTGMVSGDVVQVSSAASAAKPKKG